MIVSERPRVPTHEPPSTGSASTVPGASSVATLPSRSEWPSPKTRPRHLERQAAVYVRQSTPRQVVEHGESLARQYALGERAVALGWTSPSVLVIDQDLGLSGSGSENRLGFQRLLADVAQDRVGLVLALEISRLARNSRDWHNLFDLCAVRDVLLADEDGVYDPSDINDRLILGMKGIMSELELHIMRGRLERGRKNKAMRGELFHSVPWGYVLQPDETVASDPDEQVRATVRRLFDAFQRLGSAFAVVRELRRDDVKLPMRDGNGLLSWRVATVTVG
jgi:DNA invertase Pin-like site-specific DNA recombinase